MTDPNWLLATMAQSAAALVAIIGGFLVSRVITLSTERRGLDRRVREIRESAKDKRNLLSEARQSRREVSWHVFVDLALEDCARERGRSTAEQLADDHWIRGVSDFNEMVEMAIRLNTKMRRACQRIEHIQSTLPTPPPIPEHLRNPLINLTGESPGSRQRPIIAERLEVPRGEEDIYQAALDEIVPLERSVLLMYEPVPGDLGGEPVDTSDYADLIMEERELALEVSVLEREEGFYANELARVAQPWGLGWGAGVLGYLTIVGVIAPVVSLATRPVPSGLGSRRVLVALFISGLLALFGYLIWAVVRLYRGTKTKP